MRSQPGNSLSPSQSRRTFGRMIFGSAATGALAIHGMTDTSIAGNFVSIENIWQSIPYFANNPQNFPFQLKLPYALQNENESERALRQPLPMVVIFGGNGMGAVKSSFHADDLAHALMVRGVATMVMPYPSMDSGAIFQQAIIDRIRQLAASAVIRELKIDTTRIAFAGFSAGGLIATLLATKYADQIGFRPRAAVNYYGPVDLRLWFAFHQNRASVEAKHEFFTGRKIAGEIGHSAGGPISCETLSRRVIEKVEENMGGLRPGLLAYFSQDELWNAEYFQEQLLTHAPVLGVFGLNDDNCDPYFQGRLMRRLAEISKARHEYRYYNGPHGEKWDSCPESLEWLLNKLA